MNEVEAFGLKKGMRVRCFNPKTNDERICIVLSVREHGFSRAELIQDGVDPITAAEHECDGPIVIVGYEGHSHLWRASYVHHLSHHVTFVCTKCEAIVKIQVMEKDFKNWLLEGLKAKDAFQYLSPSECEAITKGLCCDCHESVSRNDFQ